MTNNFWIGRFEENGGVKGLPTLFVVGIQTVNDIKQWIIEHNVKHIFFGANRSFNPKNYADSIAWEAMVSEFLDQKYLCSLDIPVSYAEEFHETCLNEYDNFIPQIRIPLPYIKLWNYNTLVRLDDKEGDLTNPGVWTHELHSLMDHKTFTPKYTIG